MKNKKVLVEFIKDCYKKKGQTDYITIRQAESWVFTGLCKVVDKDVIVTKNNMSVEVVPC